MEELRFTVLEEDFSLHRLLPSDAVPENVFSATFYSLTKTSDELSIVCPDSIEINSTEKDTGWSCIKIIGPLQFSLTGILANISTCLAEAEISIFSISTYDTDYILVKKDLLELATIELIKSGYVFVQTQSTRTKFISQIIEEFSGSQSLPTRR